MRRLSPLSLATLVAVAGCGGDDEPSSSSPTPSTMFEDRTVTVAVAGTSVHYTLESCGRDGQTIRLDGRGEDGETLEASFDLGPDDATGVIESVDVILGDFDGMDLVADGSQGASPDELGQGLAARLDGDLIQMAGQIFEVDEDGERVADQPDPPRTFVLDAYCIDEG